MACSNQEHYSYRKFLVISMNKFRWFNVRLLLITFTTYRNQIQPAYSQLSVFTLRPNMIQVCHWQDTAHRTSVHASHKFFPYINQWFILPCSLSFPWILLSRSLRILPLNDALFRFKRFQISFAHFTALLIIRFIQITEFRIIPTIQISTMGNCHFSIMKRPK